MSYRMIQVGTGGFGASWCRSFLPPNVADGLIEVVAAVDLNPAAHANAIEYLDLPPEKCYTDLERALDDNPADFCTVVVPPALHEAVVDAAWRTTCISSPKSPSPTPWPAPCGSPRKSSAPASRWASP